MITLKLPYPVSVNAYWLAAGKRRFISKRGVQFKSAVAQAWSECGHRGFGDDPVELVVYLYPRDSRLMDVDNMLKCIGDSLQDAGAFTDDQQVWKITIMRGKPKKGGGCTVAIKEFTVE